MNYRYLSLRVLILSTTIILFLPPGALLGQFYCDISMSPGTARHYPKLPAPEWPGQGADHLRSQNSREFPVLPAPSLTAGDTVHLIAGDTIVSAGASFCLNISMLNFDSLASLQFSIGWDTAVVQYTGVQGFNTALNLNTGNFGISLVDSGYLGFNWSSGSLAGTTLPDSAVLFQVCFLAVGDSASSTPITFGDYPVLIEATNVQTFISLPVIDWNGAVTIGGPVACNITALAGPDTMICTGQSVLLQASGGTAYQWSSGGPAMAQWVFQPLQTAVYTVTVTDNSGCTATDSVVVTVNTLPVANANANPSAVCTGATILLNASGGTLYNWSGPAAFSSGQQNPQRPNATPAMAGAYTATVTDGNNCSATAITTVMVHPAPAATATATPNALCTGQTILLNASGGTTYSWSGPAAFSSSQQNPQRTNATTAMAGTYTVTVTDANNCSATATVTLVVNPAPTASATAQPASVCAGAILQLQATGGTSYSWTGPAGFTSVQQNPQRSGVTPAMSGVYTVTVTNANNCSATATVTATVHSLPVATATAQPPAVCTGGVIALSAGGGVSYLWSGPGAFSSGQQNPQRPNATTAMAGVYTVTVTDANDCSATATATVAVNAAPAATAKAIPPALCAGDTIGLNAVGGSGYAWSGPAGFSSNLQNPIRANATLAMSGTYTVTVTGTNGCTATATATVSVQALPTPNASTTTPGFCPGETISLQAAGGTDYNWSGPGGFSSNQQNPQIPNATAAMAGWYFVVVTNNAGCMAADSVQAQLVSGPDVMPVLTPAHCGKSDGSILLNVAGPGSFLFDWADLPGANNPQNRSNLAVGAYTVTVSNAGSNVCNTILTIVVENQDGPSAGLLTKSATCGQANGSIDLTVAGGSPPYQFIWSNNATTEDLFDIAVGTYTVTITDSGGCSNIKSITVFGPAVLEAINITEDCSPDDNIYIVHCTIAGGTPPFTLTAGAGTITGNLFTSQVLASGAAYNFQISDAAGCPPIFLSGLHDCACVTEAGTMDLTPLITCGTAPVKGIHHQDQFLPSGAILLFALHQSGSNSLGSPLAWNTTPVFSFGAGMVLDKTYYISAVAGQSNGMGGIVTSDPCLSVSPGTPVQFVSSYTYNLTDTFCAGIPYKVGNQTFTMSGNYTVLLTSTTGCDSTIHLNLKMNAPVVNLNGGQTTCPLDTVRLSAQVFNCPGCQLNWSIPNVPDTTAIVAPETTTDYAITITDNAGCTASSGVRITVEPVKMTELSVVICDSTTYQVGSESFSKAGDYEVHLVSASGCDSTVFLMLDVVQARTGYLAKADTFFFPPGAGRSSRQFNVAQNDLFPDGGSWITQLTGAAQAGKAELSGNGVLQYELMNTVFLGLDSFDYQLCDTLCTGSCVMARVYIVVQDSLKAVVDQLPNALTPNGDGINDFFNPVQYLIDKHYIIPYNRVDLSILNRWGEIVWHRNPCPDTGWDGTSVSDQPVPEGTYYYMLRMDLGETIVVKGPVMVLAPGD